MTSENPNHNPSVRLIPAMTALAAFLSLHANAFAAGEPRPIPSMEAWLLSPSGLVALQGVGPAPGVALGALDLGFVSEAHLFARSGITSQPGLHGGARLEAPIGQHSVTWLELAMEKHAFPGTSPHSPVLEMGTVAEIQALWVSARVRHAQQLVPQSPKFVTWLAAPRGFPGTRDSNAMVPLYEEQAPKLSPVSTIEGSTGWSRAHWDVDVHAALAVGPGFAPVRFANVQATRWMTPRIGMVLGVESGAPRWLTGGPVERPQAVLGMRVEPMLDPSRHAWKTNGAAGPQTFTLASLGGDMRAIRYRAPGAGRIEVRGDFTGWAPMTMRRAGIGWWELALALPPGLHQVEVSVDGGPWIPPAGLPALPGSYGVDVGTFACN
jgi:hypothetical protein